VGCSSAQKSAGGENVLEISQQHTAIIWLTHFFDPAADLAFERLAREANGFGRVFRVRQYSNSVGPPAPEIPGEILVSDVDMVQALRTRSQEIDFASGIPGEIVDLLHFAVLGKLAKFAYYWFIEYDVDFSGNWHTFFSSFQNCKADLLGTTIYPRSLDLNWYHWKTFAAPPSVPAQFVTGGFFPIFRISSRFADIYRTEIETPGADISKRSIPQSPDTGSSPLKILEALAHLYLTSAWTCFISTPSHIWVCFPEHSVVVRPSPEITITGRAKSFQHLTSFGIP
jgi:hypothetical protein